MIIFASSPALPPTAPSPSVSSVSDGLDMDPELAKYLNRSYWENKSGGVTTTASTATKPMAADGLAEALVGGADFFFFVLFFCRLYLVMFMHPTQNQFSTSSRRFPSLRRSCRTEIRPILTGIKRSFWKLCEVASKSSSTGCHRIPRVDALFPTTLPSKPSFCHSARCILSFCNIFKSKRNRGRTTKCCRFVVLSVCVLVCVLVYVCVSLCVC